MTPAAAAWFGTALYGVLLLVLPVPSTDRDANRQALLMFATSVCLSLGLALS